MLTVTERVLRPKMGNYYANTAHHLAIRNIKQHLEGKTILSYLNENGPEKLKEIFDKYSEEAILKFCKNNFRVD